MTDEPNKKNGRVLEVNDLDLVRGERSVLRLDRLTAEKGEIVALVGPNGCGKSTLFKSLAGLFLPKQGTIAIQGDPLYPRSKVDPTVRRRVVLVHQRPMVFHRTVVGNVAYGLRRRGMSRGAAAEKAMDALKSAGLEQLSGRKATDLSGGERRRVALVRALVLEPMLLLLDEPSAEVDEESLVWLDEEIRRSAETGAVLTATHDLTWAEKVAHRVIRL